MKLVFEGVPHVTVEDGGDARILEVGDTREVGAFVRIQSWIDHSETLPLEGQRLRVTVEVMGS